MKSRNLAVGGVVAFLVVVIWFMFLYKPTKSETSKVNKEVKEAERESLGLQAQLAQVSDKARNAATMKELKTLHAAVPATPQLSTFIRQANKIAAASGVSWQSVAPGQQAGQVAANSVGLNIKVQGGYAQVLDYMQRLQDLPRLVVVDSVNIAAARGTADQPTGSGGGVFTDRGADTGLALEITARMFTAAPPVTTPAPGTATGASTSGASNAPP